MTDEQPTLPESYWRAALQGADDACEVGIHPAAVNGVPRDAYKDGWNACVMEMHKRLGAYISKCLMPDPVWRMKVELVAAGVAFWGFGSFCVLLNDVFHWAFADAEAVADAEVPEVYRLWQRYPRWGAIAWAAHRRGETPQDPVLEQDEAGYREALAAVCEAAERASLPPAPEEGAPE